MSANGGVRRGLWSMFGIVLFATAMYHFDVIGRVAYAVERGRIRADQDELAQVNSADVAVLENLSRAFNLVASSVKPSVAYISTTTRVAADDDGLRRELRRFLGRGVPQGLQLGTGSGVIIDHEGHIVTNNHVVGSADRVDVTLADGRKFRAKVVGTDPMTDLAVIRIEAPRLHPARFGDSDRCAVGDIVMAIGSPFRLALTVSHGIISARGRNVDTLDIDYQDFLQTDAPINPGNSGGPLVNTRGEVIGINTAIATENGGYQGVGFSIPANKAQQIAAQLIAGKRVVRGYLGVTISDVDEATAERIGLPGVAGATIGEVIRGAPADKGGLRSGDVVLEVNSRPIETRSSLSEAVAGLEPGKAAKFRVWRDGKKIDLDVRVGEQPADFTTRPGVRRLRPGDEEPEQVVPEDDAESPKDADSDGDDGTLDELGMSVETLNPRLAETYQLGELRRGVLVTGLDPIGDALNAGLGLGDVIVAVDDQRVTTVGELRKLLSESALRRGIRLQVRSGNQTRYVGLRLR